jgi:two-component system sensor histidine kinase PilS (NtrC family)
LPALPALVDPRHLQQILTVLVQNALNYGRMPGEPARVTVHVHELDDVPVIDVSDRGPGVPDAVATQLFRPFFTTSEHGTGLGLYIARELCRANEATLEYVSVPAGGGCFRITLAGRHVLLPA